MGNLACVAGADSQSFLASALNCIRLAGVREKINCFFHEITVKPLIIHPYTGQSMRHIYLPLYSLNLV
jgi:hypothetical protein